MDIDHDERDDDVKREDERAIFEQVRAALSHLANYHEAKNDAAQIHFQSCLLDYLGMQAYEEAYISNLHGIESYCLAHRFPSGQVIGIDGTLGWEEIQRREIALGKKNGWVTDENEKDIKWKKAEDLWITQLFAVELTYMSADMIKRLSEEAASNYSRNQLERDTQSSSGAPRPRRV